MVMVTEEVMVLIEKQNKRYKNMDYQIILIYGELGQKDYNFFNNKVIYRENLDLNEAEDFVKKYNSFLGAEYKPYCPMKYEIEKKIFGKRS